MTSMTIIDQLLVLLDDEHPHSLEEMTTTVAQRSKQTVSSTLGRLIAKGWVVREARQGRGQYRTTTTGRNYVTDFLDQIKSMSHARWDGSWEQVIFNIPERDRKRRDDLRALLVRLGYGRLHGWLWISPWSHRVEVEQYITTTRSEREVTILRTGPLDQVTNQRVGRLFEWDWAALEAAYADYMQHAEQFLKQKKKDPYEARCIVYQYAKVLATDPKLPAILPTHVLNSTKAFALYERIRPFCYEVK